MIIKKLCVILPQLIHNPMGCVEEQSNASQVTESDSSNCDFWDALIDLVIGLLHGICFFYPTNIESLAAFCLSGRPTQ